MQTVSVAIADLDRDRRSSHERHLEAMPGVSLLADVASNFNATYVTRRSKPRTNITAAENEVARVKRLVPRVLLMDTSMCQDENCELVGTLRQECPGTVVLLVGTESENEELIMKALLAGARGYLSYEDVHKQMSKVADVVSRGEVWMPRKIFGKIMERVQNHEFH
jgi:DNA-binding NarL/FixJ family response regulator